MRLRSPTARRTRSHTLLRSVAALALALVAACERYPLAASAFVVPPEQVHSTAFAAPPDPSRGSVYTVLVGVSHFYGAARDLPDTAPVLYSLAGAFERALDEARSVVLIDEYATRERLVSTVRALAIRMRPQDTLVLVFYTHGDTGSLLLDDGALAEPQLGRLLDALPGNVVLVINACEAGAFAPLVAGVPRRAGLFSSREGELSYGATMLTALRTALDRRVGRTPYGGLSARNLADFVTSTTHAALPPGALAWNPLGVRSQHAVSTLGPEAADLQLGGHPTPRTRVGPDCRYLDGCVAMDEALDHVLDRMDDTGEGAERREREGSGGR